MQTRGTFPELYTQDRSATMNTSSSVQTVHPSGAMTTRPPDAPPDDETPEQLGARLGLKDHEGKLDIEASQRTHASMQEAKQARERFDKEQREKNDPQDGPKDSRSVLGDDGNTAGASNENLVGPGSPHPDAESREDIGTGGSGRDRYDGGAGDSRRDARDDRDDRDRTDREREQRLARDRDDDRGRDDRDREHRERDGVRDDRDRARDQRASGAGPRKDGDGDKDGGKRDGDTPKRDSPDRSGPSKPSGPGPSTPRPGGTGSGSGSHRPGGGR